VLQKIADFFTGLEDSIADFFISLRNKLGHPEERL
jgi:hypothetical protein